MLFLLTISSCSPFFVIRASYEETKILLARESIKELIDSEKVSSDEKEKLKLVLEARSFAKTLGLTPKDSFTLYTKVDKNPLAWVFMASQADSFTLKTWWFPFVGSVPYKGYFSKESAIEAAESAEKDGWETWIRGTDAFSTLGWFNDPVLSTTLSRDKHTIVNTVIHEIFHSTIWVKNHVDFNESVANFIGTYGMLDFYRSKYSKCHPKGVICSAELKDLKTAQKISLREADLAATVNLMFEELSRLYSKDINKEAKLKNRKEIFEKYSKPLKKKYPKLKVLTSANNAELMQLKIYLSEFDLFKNTFLNCSEDWSCFLNQLKAVEKEANKGELSPFEALKSLLGRSHQ